MPRRPKRNFAKEAADKAVRAALLPLITQHGLKAVGNAVTYFQTIELTDQRLEDTRGTATMLENELAHLRSELY